jgi:phosphopantothenoylcysteine decarboxylase / phosphopantothenate---cysteine ligase
MILLGVTGSIAAYKAVEILRLLIKSGEEVHVVMTPAATHFVGPLTFQGLSGHPVFTETLDPQAYQMAHLALAEKADAVVVAPASAESLSALAHGAAHDLVAACLLSVPRTPNGKLKAPVLIAPAMHETMWTHPATQANVITLKSYGYEFIGPETGPLGRAGDVGLGRMAEPQLITDQILKRRARQ